MKELHQNLMRDLKAIKVPVLFNLSLKPYSKTMYGNYRPKQKKITLYVYQDINQTRIVPYEELLLTLVHEAVHSIQWEDSTFVRKRGVMHDAEFHRLNNKYANRAKALLLLKEVKNSCLYF